MNYTCELKNIIRARQSCRSFSNRNISVEELFDLFWAGYSLKEETGTFTSPAAGGLDSMELRGLLKTENEWLLCGWDPASHKLSQKHTSFSAPESLFYANSTDFENASLIIIISARLEMLSARYANRAYKFACIQAGHIAQNILLFATKYGMRSLVLGLLNQDEITKVCGLRIEKPLYAVVLG